MSYLATQPLMFSPRQAPRVLVAEDSLLIALELENILRDYGCDVIGVCGSVRDALRVLETEACDLALVDYRLADETSEPLIEDLRRKSIPFILCTGQSEYDLSPELTGELAVLKPYAVEDVQNALVKAMSKIALHS